MVSTAKKTLKFLITASVLALIPYSFGAFFVSETQKLASEAVQVYLANTAVIVPHKPKPAEKPKQIILIFTGDIMLDRGVEYKIKKEGGGDFKFPFLKISDELNKADVLFGNLESVISDKGRKVGSIYSFRADPKAMSGLVFAGFDVVSVANNHVFDYSREAMEDSFKRLKEAGIEIAGGGFSEAEAHSAAVKEVNGTKIAFLAYDDQGSTHWAASGENSGIAWLEEDKLKEDIAGAKKLADIVIVSMHFGDEYKTQSNDRQKYFARLAIDSGVDLVVGHHPHVAQEVEKYNSGYIAYSLGNFVFDQGFSEETMKGLILKVLLEDDKIKELTPVEIKINENFQPEIKSKQASR